MITKMLARMGCVAAALVVLTGAARDSAPPYYTHGEYYSDGTYQHPVGGWVSCPSNKGGYTAWGVVSDYEIVEPDDCIPRIEAR